MAQNTSPSLKRTSFATYLMICGTLLTMFHINFLKTIFFVCHQYMLSCWNCAVELHQMFFCFTEF